MFRSVRVAAGLIVALGLHHAVFAATSETAKSETAKADENRKKPLQRCDQLADKAQLECLSKAREGIVEARSKREASAQKAAPAPANSKSPNTKSP